MRRRGEPHGEGVQPLQGLGFAVGRGRGESALKHALNVGGEKLMGVGLSVACGERWNIFGADALIGERHNVENEGRSR